MMKLIKETITLLIFIAIVGFNTPDLGFAGNAKLIEVKNQQVSKIDKKIKSGGLPYLGIEWFEAAEGAPPKYKYYYDPSTGKLMKVDIYVGHETWGNRFSFYFDDNEKIIEYLKVIDADQGMGFDEKLKRQAIIYDVKGKIIWKNADQPYAQPLEILRLYRMTRAVSEDLARY